MNLKCFIWKVMYRSVFLIQNLINFLITFPRLYESSFPDTNKMWPSNLWSGLNFGKRKKADDTG